MNDKKSGSYLIKSFMITFFILSLIAAVVIILTSVPGFNNTGKNQTSSQLANEVLYIPKKTDRMNILISVGDTTDALPSAYFVISIDPEGNKTTVMSLPPQIVLKTTEREATLSERYQYGGIAYAGKAIAEGLGIPVDYYFKFNALGFKSVVDKIGGVIFDIPYKLVQTDSEKNIYVKIADEKQFLDGMLLYDFMKFSLWKNGFDEQNRMQASVISTMLNQRMDDATKYKIEEIYKTAVNSAETNMSYSDFLKRSDAILYLVSQKDSCTSISLTGSFRMQNREFYPSQASLALILASFKY